MSTHAKNTHSRQSVQNRPSKNITIKYPIFGRIFRKFAVAYRKQNIFGNWVDLIRFASRSEEGLKALHAHRLAKSLVSFTQKKADTLDILLKRHRHARVLIFTADTQTTYEITQRYFIMPLTAEIRRKEREEAVAKFKTGQIRALVSCRVLNEGFDMPDADVGIIVGGSLGEREHVQRIGRLLRPAQGKRALVYELVCRNTLEVHQSKKRRAGFDSRTSTQLSY